MSKPVIAVPTDVGAYQVLERVPAADARTLRTFRDARVLAEQEETQPVPAGAIGRAQLKGEMNSLAGMGIGSQRDSLLPGSGSY